MRLADIAAFSADGLIEFSGISDLQTALIKVDQETEAICCVTCGADGVMLIKDGVLSSVPAYSANAIDTLGAGDIWHGALALAIAEKNTLKTSIQMANAAAAIKVTRPGGRNGAPTRRELNEFMDQAMEFAT